jgi:dihydrofolate reductase
MRPVRYAVAASLDGYIAGPRGEYDWIVQDPEVDFAAMFAEYDTFLMGRATYELMKAVGMTEMEAGTEKFVFSTSLRAEDEPGVTIVRDNAAEKVRELKQRSGKDIWLFGGGQLFRSLAEAGLVDSVEVAIVPHILGGGISLMPPPAPQLSLRLTTHRVYSASGIVRLRYDVVRAPTGIAGGSATT